VTEEQDLAPMLNKIWNYSKLYTRCLLTTQVALKISVLTFQRPGEIRKLKKYFYREEDALNLQPVKPSSFILCHCQIKPLT
jgi:integrase